jgi:hypothetical protein
LPSKENSLSHSGLLLWLFSFGKEPCDGELKTMEVCGSSICQLPASSPSEPSAHAIACASASAQAFVNASQSSLLNHFCTASGAATGSDGAKVETTSECWNVLISMPCGIGPPGDLPEDWTTSVAEVFWTTSPAEV